MESRNLALLTECYRLLPTVDIMIIYKKVSRDFLCIKSILWGPDNEIHCDVTN